MKSANVRRVIGSAATAFLVFFLGGCADWSRLEQAQERAHRLATELHQQRERAEQKASDAERAAPGAPETAELKNLVERLKVEESAAQQASRELDVLIQRAKGDPRDPIGQTVGAIAPWLPDPVRVPFALGTALALSLARAAQLKRAGLSIAQGLERAMDTDEQFRQRFNAHAQTFRDIQTSTAQRLVDVAQGKAHASLPV